MLKTIGFTRRQLAATVAWQATVAAIAGIAAGVPLGIALGRLLWTLFARQIYAASDPVVPVGSMILVSLCTLVLVNLMAALPGWSAARTPAAMALRGMTGKLGNVTGQEGRGRADRSRLPARRRGAGPVAAASSPSSRVGSTTTRRDACILDR